jgi:hypothetical protein
MLFLYDHLCSLNKILFSVLPLAELCIEYILPPCTCYEFGRYRLYKIPRVVADQRARFYKDDIFRIHNKYMEVKYTLYRVRPMEERRTKFYSSCRDGHIEITYPASGLSLSLNLTSALHKSTNTDGSLKNFCDFQKDCNKVHIRSSLILNGVCVFWQGWIDLFRLEGMGCLGFDDGLAEKEDLLLKRQIKQYTRNESSSSTRRYHEL